MDNPVSKKPKISKYSSEDYKLLDPTKIRGKITLESKNTDITADPIDNPPEKSFVADLPKEKAEIEQPKKEYTEIDIPAIWLSVLLLIASLIFAGSGLAAFLRVVCAFGSLFFNFKNTRLNVKKFPKLGFNPLNVITAIDCVLLLLGIFRLFMFLITFGAA